MTKKEYLEIMEEMKKNTFSHIYQSLDVEPHDECVKVIAYEDVINILHGYIKKKKRRKKE